MSVCLLFTINTIYICKHTGQSTFVEVVVDGNPFPKVTWYKEKVEVVQGVKYKTELDTTTGIATLFIEKCRQKDEAPYTVNIHNEHGEAHAVFHLYVKGIRTLE